MGRKSRTKGKVGELEVVKVFKAAGIDARRVSQLQAGAQGDPDVHVAVDGLHVEVKRQETLRLPEWTRQAERDAAVSGAVPAVAYRQNQQPWRVSVPLEWLAGVLAGAYHRSD